MDHQPDHPQAPSRESLAAWVSDAFKRGVRDNTLAEFGAQTIRFAGIVVLARILTPSDFGIMKALLAVTLIAVLFLQAGIPSALVQRRELTRDHECAGWWMGLTITSATVAIIYFAAPLIAAGMQMPILKPGVRWMCLPIFIEGGSMVSNARLERALRFGALALADVLAEVAFLIGAVVLLVLHLPQWSLIVGLAARFAAHGLAVWIASPRLYVRLPRMRSVRDLLGFAISVWGGTIVQAVSDNSDSLLIGRILGSGPLGLYGMARDLLRAVPNRLHKVAGRVTYAAFCKLQDDDRELSRVYAQFYNLVARIMLPMMACMAITAPDLVLVAYGRSWTGAVLPLQILALGLAFASLKIAISSAYHAKGYPSLDIHLNGLRLVLVVTVIFALRNTGLLGIAAGISAVEVVTSIVSLHVGGWFTGLDLADTFRESLPALRLSVICGAASLLGSGVAHYFGIHGASALAIALFPAGVAYLSLESANLLEIVRQAFAPRAAEPGFKAEVHGVDAAAL